MKSIVEALEAALPLGIPRGQGTYFEKDPFSPTGFCACAVGLAMLGAGIVTMEELEEENFMSGPDSDPDYDTLSDLMEAYGWDLEDVGSVIQANDSNRKATTLELWEKLRVGERGKDRGRCEDQRAV